MVVEQVVVVLGLLEVEVVEEESSYNQQFLLLPALHMQLQLVLVEQLQQIIHQQELLE